MLRNIYSKEQKKFIKDNAYTGNKINCIHFKFGDCRKNYQFNEWFEKQEPEFVKAYETYFEMGSPCAYSSNPNKDITNTWLKECLKMYLKYSHESKIEHRLFIYDNYCDKFLDSKKQIEKYIAGDDKKTGCAGFNHIFNTLMGNKVD